MLKKLALTLLGLAVIIVFLIGSFAMMIRHLIAAGAAQVMPPTSVTTMQVKPETWDRLLSSVGTVSAVQGVTVSAQLDGAITRIAFEPGSRVNAGDLLVQQDVSSEEAQLRSAEAAARLAEVNLKRSAELLKKNTIAQSQYDSDAAAFAQAKAQEDNIRATIAKKTIRAPFSGRLGVRMVDLGQVLKAGDPIVSLQSLEPVYVDFFVPQRDLSELSSGLDVRATSDAYPNIAAGSVTTIDPALDTATRNIHVQATLPNAKEQLRPGMFVNLDVVLPGKLNVLAVPLTAVLFAPYGDSVFVVEQQRDPQTGRMQQVARQQVVRLGVKRGDFVAVESGLKAGETIVTSGAFKLRSGMPVATDNALAPAAELAPKPADS
jgi:membrane fusion protein (multidrug efflux system)